MTLTSLEICTGASDGSNAADYGVFNAVQIQGLDQVLEAERRHRAGRQAGNPRSIAVAPAVHRA